MILLYRFRLGGLLLGQPSELGLISEQLAELGFGGEIRAEGNGRGRIHPAEIGAADLNTGASRLHSGTQSLSEGATQLTNGILTLKNGVPALTEGVTLLRDGAMTLNEGLKTFNTEGISKITSLKDSDLGKVATRLKATADVAKHYKSYSGLTDEMDGEVKFIYKTEEIK